MSSDQIKKRISEIQLRFEQERWKFMKGMALQEDDAFRQARIEAYVGSYYIRLHRAVLFEVAGEIIAPYCRGNSNRKIVEFIRYHKELYQHNLVENRYPKLHGFFEWYCDSDTIRREIDVKNSTCKSNDHSKRLSFGR